MKKYLSIFTFLLLAIVVSASTVAYGENGENRGPGSLNKGSGEGKSFMMPKGEREEFREKMKGEREAFLAKLKAEREAFTSELKAKKEEFKKKTKETKEEWRGKAMTMIGQRFEVAVRNLERIQTRVQEAINKLGDDTVADDAQALLDQSKKELEDAKKKIAEIKTLLPDSGEKITVEIFEKIKLLAREAKDLLKESHDSLKQAVKVLKGENEDDDDDKSVDENDSN